MSLDAGKVSLPWLVRLRWGVLAGQLGAVLFAYELLAADLRLGRIALLVSLTTATNAALAWKAGRDPSLPRGWCGTILTFDTLVLTALLQSTGGAANPFSVLYLVHITLAAMVLGAAWTSGLTLLAVVAYRSLFLGDEHAQHLGHEYATHLQGMWVAFALTAALTAAFVVRLTAAIQRRDREIESIRDQAARSERLASLTTLAAGAAHELGTPLATIAVVAGELERALTNLSSQDAAPLVDDARLIRSQLDRCRQILDQMTAAAGEVAGEAPAPIPLTRLLDEVRADLVASDAARLRVHVGIDGEVMVPHRALARAVVNLVRNAFDASEPKAPVDVAVEPGESGSLRFAVSDTGHGMTASVLERATEPFFTTKSAGRGMGMGLFLARALVEQLGGRLQLASAPGSGTTVTLELPAAVMREREGARGV